MISRFCIEEGMEEMESYNLSDFYINKLDKAQTERQIIDVHNQLIMDYARRMKKVKKKADPERDMEVFFKDLEEKLKGVMGTKVSINRKDKNKGRIEIEYYSSAELERLIELLESLRQ